MIAILKLVIVLNTSPDILYFIISLTFDDNSQKVAYFYTTFQKKQSARGLQLENHDIMISYARQDLKIIKEMMVLPK